MEIGNPNYGHVHTQKMATIREKAANLSWKGHFGLCDPGLGKIGIKYRTILGGVEEYLESADLLRDIVANQSIELGVLPHAYSQHIHLSLEVQHKGETANQLDGIKEQEFFSRLRRTRDLIKRVKPMVNRPDAFNQIDSPAIPVQLKGKNYGTDGPNRMEVRRLSRHWAADPSLNLALALQALQDEVVPTDRSPFTEPDDFVEGVSKMRTDPDLMGILGRSLLGDIAGILGQYLLVSGGQISIGEVKKGKNI